MIEIKDISKTFDSDGSKVRALRHCSLRIEKGEIFGIIGHSGAGKSTLLRIINQLEKQDEGEVYLGDEAMSKLGKKELLEKRMKIGMIFQHFNLLHSKTVAQKIELPLKIAHIDKKIRETRVKELIELVGLKGKEKAYPSKLSGGQKQRVGIARALANSPDILLCDEATSALDPKTSETILDLLRDINQKLGITIVLITHQMEVVQKICQRIAFMSEGEIVEVGPTGELFAHPQNIKTKQFLLSSTSEIERTSKDLKEFYPDGQLLRLVFDDQNSDRPILAKIIKETDLPLSIVSARIAPSLKGTVGSMYVHIAKIDEEKLKELLTLMAKYQVKAEVI